MLLVSVLTLVPLPGTFLISNSSFAPYHPISFWTVSWESRRNGVWSSVLIPKASDLRQLFNNVREKSTVDTWATQRNPNSKDKHTSPPPTHIQIWQRKQNLVLYHIVPFLFYPLKSETTFSSSHLLIFTVRSDFKNYIGKSKMQKLTQSHCWWQGSAKGMYVPRFLVHLKVSSWNLTAHEPHSSRPHSLELNKIGSPFSAAGWMETAWTPPQAHLWWFRGCWELELLFWSHSSPQYSLLCSVSFSNHSDQPAVRPHTSPVTSYSQD